MEKVLKKCNLHIINTLSSIGLSHDLMATWVLTIKKFKLAK
jgi:hypothetical protein